MDTEKMNAEYMIDRYVRKCNPVRKITTERYEYTST